MTHFRNVSSDHPHGPDNAEHEIRKAYNCVIETGVTHLWDHRPIPGVNPQDALKVYKHAFNCYRQKRRLAAERWARTAKHLSRALWHEAKLAYLEPHAADLPFLEGAREDEYMLHERSDTTEDLLNSVTTLPPGMNAMPPDMTRYLERAKHHLKVIASPDYKHELLRAERIKAAHEYGRTLECMALAYEAEQQTKAA